jgi:hypothetical protein
MTMTINAVSDKQEFSISAALEKLPRAAFRLMARADVAMPTGKIDTATLDRQLANSRLTLDERLQLKVSLSHAGIL